MPPLEHRETDERSGDHAEAQPNPTSLGDSATQPAGRRSLAGLIERVIRAIREGDEQKIEDSLVQLSSTRRIYAPLALLVGGILMLFNGLRLLVTNWRLMLIQVLPAMLIWCTTYDLKAHVFRGKEFHVIRGPLLVVVFLAIVLVTIGSFYLNAVFAFAISRTGPPDIRAGFRQARTHLKTVFAWGLVVGAALAVAALIIPRSGHVGLFGLVLGIVLAVLMVLYVAVPARIIGVKADAQLSGRDKAAATVVRGAVSAVVCTPPYTLSRIGLILLGGGNSFPFGVILLVIGMTLQAGATGAVKAIKLSTKLLAGQGTGAPATES